MSYLNKYSNYKYNVGDNLFLKKGSVRLRNSIEDNYINEDCEVKVIQQSCSLINNLYNVKILSGNLKDLEALEIVEDNLYKKQTKPIKAIAVFDTENIKGKVNFTQDLGNNKVIIDINIIGLNPNSKHGFHVHECGDMSDKCDSMCAHFNPFNKNHGCPNSIERHVGDLGNLIADENGIANYRQEDDVIKLEGECNIIGRGLIIHADEDDCGLGIDNKREESLKTGNAGKRIACAVIGYAKTK
jgi:Cu-Zn family superoxide dismutase